MRTGIRIRQQTRNTCRLRPLHLEPSYNLDRSPQHIYMRLVFSLKSHALSNVRTDVDEGRKECYKDEKECHGCSCPDRVGFVTINDHQGYMYRKRHNNTRLKSKRGTYCQTLTKPIKNITLRPSLSTTSAPAMFKIAAHKVYKATTSRGCQAVNPSCDRTLTWKP
jgi:hypothetical protein